MSGLLDFSFTARPGPRSGDIMEAACRTVCAGTRWATTSPFPGCRAVFPEDRFIETRRHGIPSQRQFAVRPRASRLHQRARRHGDAWSGSGRRRETIFGDVSRKARLNHEGGRPRNSPSAVNERSRHLMPAMDGRAAGDPPSPRVQPIAMSSQPLSSTRATSFSPMTTVVVSDSTIAGPVMC